MASEDNQCNRLTECRLDGDPQPITSDVISLPALPDVDPTKTSMYQVVGGRLLLAGPTQQGVAVAILTQDQRHVEDVHTLLLQPDDDMHCALYAIGGRLLIFMFLGAAGEIRVYDLRVAPRAAGDGEPPDNPQPSYHVHVTCVASEAFDISSMHATIHRVKAFPYCGTILVLLKAFKDTATYVLELRGIRLKDAVTDTSLRSEQLVATWITHRCRLKHRCSDLESMETGVLLACGRAPPLSIVTRSPNRWERSDSSFSDAPAALSRVLTGVIPSVVSSTLSRGRQLLPFGDRTSAETPTQELPPTEMTVTASIDLRSLSDGLQWQFRRITIVPWNRHRAIAADSAGRVYLVCSSPLRIFHLFDGVYRDVDFTFIFNSQWKLLVLYLAHRGLMEFWDLCEMSRIAATLTHTRSVLLSCPGQRRQAGGREAGEGPRMFSGWRDEQVDGFEEGVQYIQGFLWTPERRLVSTTDILNNVFEKAPS